MPSKQCPLKEDRTCPTHERPAWKNPGHWQRNGTKVKPAECINQTDHHTSNSPSLPSAFTSGRLLVSPGFSDPILFISGEVPFRVVFLTPKVGEVWHTDPRKLFRKAARSKNGPCPSDNCLKKFSRFTANTPPRPAPLLGPDRG